ncbi:MAG: DUF4112 domain-containing protein [Nitrospirae bacterium]|nr:MAG: DUF4112 domain-containing protein [Nitrospirota bacterium]
MATVRVKEQQVETLAHLLDDAFRLGTSRVRFGLDPLLGFVPVVGDVLVTVCGAVILVIARQLGVPIIVLIRMTYNLLVNGLLGTVPLVGDLYSFQFMYHAKNTALPLRAVKRRDEVACDIVAPSLSLVDLLVVPAMMVPVVLLIGYVSLWLWDREIHLVQVLF